MACQKPSQPTAAKETTGTAAGPTATDPWAAADPTAPAADPWAGQPIHKDPIAHPFLWSIEKDGKTSYALGTFHVGVDAETRLPQLVWDKLDGATTLVTETDLADPVLQTAFSVRKDGKTLHEEIGDVYWSKLAALLPHPVNDDLGYMTPQRRSELATQRVQALTSGITIDQVDHGTATRATLLLPASGFQVTQAMDTMLLAHAINHNEKLVYLEPAEKQARLLLKWMDARALEMMLDDLAGLGAEARTRLATYLAGDERELVAQGILFFPADWKKAGRSDAEYETMMEDMIYERNASWISELEQIHASGGGFIAVGVLHLVGKRSVLDLLAKRGYKITRL
jgi:uncharacterized protein YbaP (TraB family)